MAQIEANGIRIEYDTFGDRRSPALLLIMGLGIQMIGWHAELCEMLAQKGLYVIRFDNRDVGLSQKFEELGIPRMMKVFADALAGKPMHSPYSLDDMADDAVGLLSALKVGKAHICGASMGGMIAQIIAYRYPERVKSLTSIMSTTGDPTLPQATAEAMAAISTPVPLQREASIEHHVRTWRAIGSPGFPFDERRVREMGARTYDRCFYPQGWARQMVAIMAHGNRTRRLKEIKSPTLVIHGSADPLVPVEGGRATAGAIPGAKLLIIEGMGHDFPEGAWEEITSAIADHIRGAEG